MTSYKLKTFQHGLVGGRQATLADAWQAAVTAANGYRDRGEPGPYVFAVTCDDPSNPNDDLNSWTGKLTISWDAP